MPGVRCRAVPGERGATTTRAALLALLAIAITVASTGLPAPASAGPASAQPLPPLSPFDPGVPGPYKVRRHEVNGGWDAVRLRLPKPVELVAELTYPTTADGRPAPGRRPLVLLLHGQHADCYRGQDNNSDIWPCPRGWKPFPNYQGYRYMTELLSSQGYVTVSISADGINGQDDFHTPDAGMAARAALVDRHLQLIAQAAGITAPTPFTGARRRHNPYPPHISRTIDLQRVMMLGHSRGGEGVALAQLNALTRRTPYRVRALVAMASTNGGQLLVPNTPHIALLPQCDGDVFTLEGQLYVDSPRLITNDRALRSAVFIPGANHNFLNTMWTPGESITPQDDDAAKLDDTNGPCNKALRLSPADEQRVARSYVAAAAALWLRGDERALPLMEGRRLHMASTGSVNTRVTPVAGAARLLQTRWRNPVRSEGPMQATRCRRILNCAGQVGWSSADTPHWQPNVSMPRTPYNAGLELFFQRPGGTGWTALPRPADLRGGLLTARIAVGVHLSQDMRIALAVRDGAGRTARVEVPENQIQLLSRPGIGAKLWAEEAQVPTAALATATPGLDLGDIREVGITAVNGAGRLFVLDLWHRQRRLISPIGEQVPQVSPTLRWRRTGDRYTIRVGLRVSGPTPGRPILARMVVDAIAKNQNETSRWPVQDFHIRIPAGRRSAVVTKVARTRQLQTNLITQVLPLSGAVPRHEIVRVPYLVPSTGSG
jgi:hypothetical protein